MNNTAENAEHRARNLEGQIRGLALQLSKLEPLPGSDIKGPAFVSLASQFKPAADYEGMLGSMLLDGCLSDIFEGSANDNAQNALKYGDYISTYIEERGSDAHNNYGRGRGSIARYERKMISKPFNVNAQQHVLEDRLNIEEAIADLVRRHGQTILEMRIAS